MLTRVKNKLKKEKEVLAAMIGASMAYLASVSPVFAANSSSDIANKIRGYLFPFYVLAVGGLCIMSWLKGQMAPAIISLVVGVFFGLILFAPKFVGDLLSTVGKWFGAGTIRTA